MDTSGEASHREPTRSQILTILRDATGEFISGEELRRSLGISRTAIWKQIEELREDGYEIEAKPRLGYRILTIPDRVSSEELKHHLKTSWLGRGVIHYYDEVSSTNLVAKELAAKGAAHGTIVIAEAQTGGRGRLGRSWISPKGKGAWLSIILRPRVEYSRLPQITLLTALAVRDATSDITHLPAGIKWPNDILVSGRKVCGILTEVKGEMDRIEYVVLGIGVNLNLEEDDFPPEIRRQATSLRIELGGPVPRAAFIAALLGKVEEWYELWLERGFEPVRSAWKKASITLGGNVRLISGGKPSVGEALDMDDQGALLVKDSNGKVRRFISGEIELQ